MKKIIIYFPLILLLTISCEETNYNSPGINQLVLFQVEYINYAWGYSHGGIIIDSAGNAKRFSYPESWNYPDTAGYISESDMNENVKQLGKVSLKVEKDSLLRYFNMLEAASEGKLSDPYNRMFDAGETTYTGYFYFPLERKYKQILIKQWGDWEIDNNSKEAEAVFEWLSSVYRATFNNR